MASPEKRKREIKIRLTEQEHQALLQRSTRASLAVWVRETCLGEKPSPRSQAPKCAPELLRQVISIGNNINQIARAVNQQTALGALDKIKLTLALGNIEKAIQGIKNDSQNS